MQLLKFTSLVRCYLIALAETVKENTTPATNYGWQHLIVNAALNPYWQFPEGLYRAHIDLYCEIYYYLGYPQPHETKSTH